MAKKLYTVLLFSLCFSLTSERTIAHSKSVDKGIVPFSLANWEVINLNSKTIECYEPNHELAEYTLFSDLKAPFIFILVTSLQSIDANLHHFTDLISLNRQRAPPLLTIITLDSLIS